METVMARTIVAKSRKASSKKVAGLGFIPTEARHGFLIDVPKGKGRNDWISIAEYRNVDISQLESNDQGVAEGEDGDLPRDRANLRVLIDRGRWLELAPSFFEEANRRLRSNGHATFKFQKNPSKPIPVHPSLGKELCILCWAIEEAPPESIPNALLNWEALAPEERWWLYTMTVATTGQAMQKGVGWRKALRAALAENQFVKGEGSSPKSRRELLGHAQLIRPLIQQVFRWQQRISGAPKAVLRLDLDHEYIEWFPARFRNIVDNLIVHALRLRNDEKGEVRLGIELTTLANAYELRFTDNGSGAPASKWSGEDELFYRSASTRAAGLGGGLAVVRYMVEQCCGSVAVSSGESQGTSVVVTLPRYGLNDHLEA